MKKYLFFISVICFFNYTMLQAQVSGGKLILGVSSSLNVVNTGSNIMSLGLSSTNYKSNASGYTEPDPSTSYSFNLLPKVGYMLTKNIALGIDANIATYSYKRSYLGQKYNYKSSLINAGPFARFYFDSNKVFPYLEAGGSYGLFKETSTSTPEYKNGIFKIGGGLGMAISLGEKATFDALFGYNSITVKDKENNPNNERVVIETFEVKLGFTIFL
ncbi:MAG: outer membrane beta-barrel protein [Bacteroidetes bacterium]|nr:outer membrane beta-barrel protein [Bacteroidota bacterium]PIX32410.1 MAG: hypothetical protein COZ59_14170 [Bacteroidetes bacterium CG_4_8_14_3_um_filter_31_14]